MIARGSAASVGPVIEVVAPAAVIELCAAAAVAGGALNRTVARPGPLDCPWVNRS
jgi:hypothetical protein